MEKTKLLYAKSPEESKVTVKKPIIWTKKDLLGLEYLTKEEIELVLEYF